MESHCERLTNSLISISLKVCDDSCCFLQFLSLVAVEGCPFLFSRSIDYVSVNTVLKCHLAVKKADLETFFIVYQLQSANFLGRILPSRKVRFNIHFLILSGLA